MQRLELAGIVLEFVSFWLVAPEILGEDRMRAFEEWFESQVARLQTLQEYLIPIVLIGAVLPITLATYTSSLPYTLIDDLVGVTAIFAAMENGQAVSLEWLAGYELSFLWMPFLFVISQARVWLGSHHPVKWIDWCKRIGYGLLVLIVIVLAGVLMVSISWGMYQLGNFMSLILVTIIFLCGIIAFGLELVNRGGWRSWLVISSVSLLLILVFMVPWIIFSIQNSGWLVLALVVFNLGIMLFAWLLVIEKRVADKLLHVLSDDSAFRRRSLIIGAWLFVGSFVCQVLVALTPTA